MMRLRNRSLIGVIFAVAVVFRLALALVNRWDNDNHLDVVNLILDSGELPKPGECWECHQPKLFYLSVIGLAKLFSLPRGTPLILAAQGLNALLSLVALGVFARFLKGLSLSHAIRNLVFLAVAMNTCWWGISGQATNDTMCITFGLMAFVCSFRFFEKPRASRLLACALSCTLAALSKFSGMLVTLLCAFNIGLSLFSERRALARTLLSSRWVLGAFLLLAPIPVLGGYLQAWKVTGDPFFLNMPKYPAPSLFEETVYSRPGIKSVWTGYFTFRVFDAVAHPYTNNDWDLPAKPLHRTSMWSQLYGRLFFTRFDSWPPAWASQDSRVLWVGRAALVTALAAVAVFWVGWFSSLRALWLRWLRPKDQPGNSPLGKREFLQISGLAISSAFLMAMIKVTALGRDYCFMKFVYLLPGLLGFVSLFIEGWIVLQRSHPGLFRVLATLIVLLAVIHAVDMSWLIYDLARQPA